MSAKIISGVEIAKAIRDELKQEVAELKEKHNIVPGLVTILVGEDPASVSYVTAKGRTANELGIYSEQLDLSAEALVLLYQNELDVMAFGSGPGDFVGCAEPGNATTNNDDLLHIFLKNSSECLVRLPTDRQAQAGSSEESV